MKPAAPVPHVAARYPMRRRLRDLASRPRRALEGCLAPLWAFLALTAAAGAWFVSQAHLVGVTVEMSSRPAPSDLLSLHDHIYFLAGLTERGSIVDPIDVRSLSDYADKCGDRVAYGTVYDDLATFFAEGGTRAYVARVVGPAATLGTLELDDRAGAPLPTLRVDAASVGAWSSRVSVAVSDGAVADTFTVDVYLDGVIAESYPNLASPAAAAAAMATSQYVDVTNLGSATAAPTNNPAVAAAVPLSAGTDDRAAVVAATYVAALDRFDKALGTGDVAIPGQSAANVGAGLIAHGNDRNRAALLAPPVAQTVAQTKAAVTAFLGSTGSESAGLAYPWIRVDDGVGGSRTISPEGYLAACRARARRLEGPWRAAAGDLAVARTVLGVERVLTEAEISDLNDHQVIPIAVIGGRVQPYGARSLSLDLRNFRLMTGRDVMNVVAVLGVARLRPYVFGTVDGRGHFQHQLESEMRAVLEPMQSAGGLYERVAADGSLLSPGYTVDAGSAVNTVDVLARDEVIVDVALRVSPTGELIRLRLTKVAFDANL